MNRILFIDDRADASQLASNIMSNGYTVECANNLCDAEYYLTENPGADSYDVIFLDLDMRITDLPHELRDEAKRTFAGWVFYIHIVAQYPKLYKSTIIYTGFAQEFMSKVEPEERKDIYLLDKSTPNLIQRAMHLLNEIGKGS